MEFSLTPKSLPGETARRLMACNAATERFGLSLTAAEAAELAESRGRVLRDTGRVEFSGGVLPRLAMAFCDSPWAEAETWAETLQALQELFYHLKNDTGLSDDDLMAAMRRTYDGPAHGSTALLADRLSDRPEEWEQEDEDD